MKIPFPFIVWGNLAESFVKYCSKGDIVTVYGQWKGNYYIKQGIKLLQTTCHVDQIDFHNKRLEEVDAEKYEKRIREYDNKVNKIEYKDDYELDLSDEEDIL